jgi:hypothetical protein
LVSGVSLDLSKAISGQRYGKVRIYDVWANRWSEVKIRDGRVALPEFSRSIVLRLE